MPPLVTDSTPTGNWWTVMEVIPWLDGHQPNDWAVVVCVAVVLVACVWLWKKGQK